MPQSHKQMIMSQEEEDQNVLWIYIKLFLVTEVVEEIMEEEDVFQTEGEDSLDMVILTIGVTTFTLMISKIIFLTVYLILSKNQNRGHSPGNQFYQQCQNQNKL